jgi:hypothetical protein
MIKITAGLVGIFTIVACGAKKDDQKRSGLPAKGADGSTPPESKALTCTLSPGSSTIVSGDSTPLVLHVTGTATSGVLNGQAVENPEGASTTVLPTTTSTYNATVSNADGEAHCATTVEVTSAPVASCSITANPASVVSGSTTTITMTVKGEPTAATLQGKSASIPTATTAFIPTETTLVSGSVTGSDGKTATCSAQVQVVSQASVCVSTDDVLTGLRYADVSPIFATRCVSCHKVSTDGGNRPGVAISSLETYLDVKLAASGIDTQIYRVPDQTDPDGPATNGGMPPNDPLCARDYNKLKAWIAAGTPD